MGMGGMGMTMAAPTMAYDAAPVMTIAAPAMTMAAPTMSYDMAPAMTMAAPTMAYDMAPAMTMAAPAMMSAVPTTYGAAPTMGGRYGGGGDLFSLVDTNQDGGISRSEFMRAFG